MRFLARRVGVLWASAPVVLFWCSPYFQYATEIRPYAQLLAFFSLALVSWNRAISGQRRGWALAGVFLGVTGMMLSHVLAVFSIGALLLAELVRTVRRRPIDWALWVMLLLPLSAVLTYIPLMQRFESGSFPQRFQGGQRKVAVFFAKAALGIAVPFALGCVATGIAYWRLKRTEQERKPRVRYEDYALLVGMLLPVFLINLMFMRTHGAFFERYCITSALALCIMAVLVLGIYTGFRRGPAFALLGAFLCVGLTINFVRPGVNILKRKQRDSFDAIQPALPVVAASGLAFMEMDHYENPELIARLHFLVDGKAAVQYAQATIFEGMPTEKRYFPIRGSIEKYQDFVAVNRHFLVFGTMDNLPYNDHDVYEVTIPDGSPALLP